MWAIVEFSFGPHDGGPIVDRRGLHAAQRRTDDLHVWIILHDAFDHRLEWRDIERAGLVHVHAFGVIAEHLLEVFFVANETVDVWHERLGGRNRFFAFPELGAEVQI